MTPRAIRRGRLRPSAGARGCDRGRNDAERLQPRTPACSTNFENAEIRARFQSGGDSSDRLRARRIWYAKFHSGVGTTPEALVLARARRRDARLGASAVLRRRVHVRIGRGVEPHVEAHTLPVRVDARSAFDPRVDPARGRARDSDPNSHRPRVPPRPRPVPSRRQPFPDNHTDDSFLERLVLNGRITPRRLSRVVLDATAVSQQLAVVALKATSVAHLLSGRLRPDHLILADAALLALGVLVIAAIHGPLPAARQSLRVGPPMLLGLVALTPLFRTMTAAISDDTAVASAACSFFLHLLTYDYAFLNSYTARLASPVSLGAAVFAALLLASRLSDPEAVFGDVLLAVALFVLFPFLRRDVREASVAAHVALTVASHAAALGALAALPEGGGRTALVWGYVAGVGGVVVACPAWLVRMMRFKRQINGPWDEAKPHPELLVRDARKERRNRDE